jgi:hypothetical protein
LVEYLSGTGTKRGYVATAQTMYDLSKDWYRTRMDEDWEPPTPAEAESMLAGHGLTGDFWGLT